MSKTSELFAHVQRFVREVYADRLREAGFVSYKGEDIHWYRLVNDEVIHAVYFVTRHTALHSILDIEYGCHPLYIPPIFQKSPYFYGLPGFEQMYDSIPEIIPGSMPRGTQHSSIFGMSNRPYRWPDILISYPFDPPDTAMAILDRVLSILDQATTPRACFELHKQWRSSNIENESYWEMSPYFVDEVLYWKDEALYPFCQRYVEVEKRCLEKVAQNGKLIRKQDKTVLEQLTMLQKVFEEDAIEQYVQTFYEREQTTRKLLEKYTGIRF